MSTVFIFHGIGGDSQENWFPWMKAELEKVGHRVIVQNFPNSNTPNLSDWLAHMEKYKESIDEETVFIGHSLGAAFALRSLERMKQKIHRTFLVSPVWKTPSNEFAPLMTSFTEAPYDFSAISKNAGPITILHGDNDPYLSLAYVEELQKNLECEMMVIPDGGHLNATAGYTAFPALRDFII